jgi:hypothetical protein
MILKINLAPEIDYEPTLRDFLPAILATTCALSAAYMGPSYYAATIRSEAEEVSSKTEQKKQQLASLQADLKKAEVLQNAVKEIEARKAVLEELTLGRRQPVFVLEKLQYIHPERMWINSLDITPSRAVLKGWATSHNIISDYVHRIKTVGTSEDSSSIDVKIFTPSFSTLNNTPVANDQSKSHDSQRVHVKFTQVALKESTTRENKDASPLPIQNFEVEFNPNLELR